jgi:DNA-binding MarR family transcriptional regulator
MSTMALSRAPAADVLHSFRVMRQALSRAAAAAFSETGVGPRQTQLLREIRRGKSVSQADLSRATSTDPAGLMRSLDALERRGWVKRVACEEDRRRKLVTLTAEGRSAMRLLDARYESLRKLTNRALTLTEREQFSALAAKLAAVLEATVATASVEEEA